MRTGIKIVTTAGNAERLSSQSLAAAHLRLTAPITNTGVVGVGDKFVEAAPGNQQALVILYPGDFMDFDNVDLLDIWLDSTVDREGIFYGIRNT